MINNFAVVGGGTAGCMAALMLKAKYPEKNVRMIRSPEVGIIGVGESSTEHWMDFCRFVGINQIDVIKKTNAVFKLGILFKDWSKNTFMHSVTDPMQTTNGSYYKYYGHLIANKAPHDWMQTPYSWDNKVSLKKFNNINDFPTNQYNFDTFALNEFLTDLCIERGIDIIYDHVIDVTCKENGDIEYVNGKNGSYHTEFVIDCSGFSRLLLQKHYNSKWISYSEYLPLNSTIIFPTEEQEEYNNYVLCTARKCGWSWETPTQTRTGNGYVYSDKYITKDEAHREMEECFGRELDVKREFKFNPGRLEKAWINNCFAIGLAQNFIEPLEATSIGSGVQQMFCFLHYFPSNNQDECNEKIAAIFDNLVDYVQAHYITQREDTDFWKDLKYGLKLTPSLQRLLEIWKTRLPQDIDIKTPWGMFYAANYIPLLYGLDWFDVDKIKEEYLLHNLNYDDLSGLDDIVIQSEEQIWVSHKKIIKLLIES
jgi:tryptophan halogenase